MSQIKTINADNDLLPLEAGLYIPPPMTAERYAKLQGVTVDTVNNQIRRGHLPTIKTGKRRLINTFALARKCLATE